MRVFATILFVLHGVASADMMDFFESYALNTWPSPNWARDGNASTDPVNNHVELDPAGGTNQEGPATIPAPGAALLGLMGATIVGWLRRRRTL